MSRTDRTPTDRDRDAVPTAVWAYPWTFEQLGLDTAMRELRRAGVSRINLAAHYHSICAVAPRNGIRYDRYPGGCFFEPSEGNADDRIEPSEGNADDRIEPPRNDIPGMDDPLAAICRGAAEYGIDVTAWTVCLHNTRLASAYPDYRPIDAFGNELTHGLCPSNPAVRQYLRRIIRTLAGYDVCRIDLESIGFPTAFHGHGDGFGHVKNFAASSDVAKLLLSQCFCSSCRTAASRMGTPIDVARELIRELVGRIGRSPTTSGISASTPAELLEAHPALESLVRFRCRTIGELIGGLADASGDVPLHYYVADGLGRGSEDGTIAGVDLPTVGKHLDSVTTLYYTAEYDSLDGRASNVRSRSGVPVEIGLTVDPDVVTTDTEWEEYREYALDRDPVAITVYNYSLMTDDHVRWLEHR